MYTSFYNCIYIFVISLFLLLLPYELQILHLHSPSRFSFLFLYYLVIAPQTNGLQFVFGWHGVMDEPHNLGHTLLLQSDLLPPPLTQDRSLALQDAYLTGLTLG